jgi:hypothetical protein
LCKPLKRAVQNSFPDINRESYCSVSLLQNWSLCCSFEREIVSNGKPATRIRRALRRIKCRAYYQFGLYRFSHCCFTKTNLPSKIAVFNIMTAYALRTRQFVPLESRYVSTSLQGVIFHTTNHPVPKFRTHTRNYIFWGWPYYGPGVDSTSNEISTRNILGGKGSMCVGLTTLPPSRADCLKIWESQPPGTLRACQGL